MCIYNKNKIIHDIKCRFLVINALELEELKINIYFNIVPNNNYLYNISTLQKDEKCKYIFVLYVNFKVSLLSLKRTVLSNYIISLSLSFDCTVLHFYQFHVYKISCISSDFITLASTLFYFDNLHVLLNQQDIMQFDVVGFHQKIYYYRRLYFYFISKTNYM